MTDLIRMRAAPTGMRLNEWVALDQRFFEAEGLDVQINWDGLKVQQGKLGKPEDKDQTEIDKLLLGQLLTSEISSACAWGTVCMTGAGRGKFVTGVHGVSPCAVYVQPDSNIREPKDLRGVPIAVGLRAGSHFSLLSHLERHMPLADINVVNHGGFGARLQVLVDGDVEASSLLPPQIYMAEQLGFRKVLSGEFWTGWWVEDGADSDKVDRYLRAIDRAEAALNEDMSRYLHLWAYSNPAEFEDHNWDYATFGRGERFVREAVSQKAYDELLNDAHRWGLDNHMDERDFAKLAYAPPA